MTPLGCTGGSQLTNTESLENGKALIFSGADGTVTEIIVFLYYFYLYINNCIKKT